MIQEYHRLNFKEETISKRMKRLIEQALRENNRRITFRKGYDDDDYPLTTILSRRKDVYFISITDVYLNEYEEICADGIDDDTTCLKTGFKIYADKYSNILFFIAYVLNWNDKPENVQGIIESVNSDIIELANELAEKEMVDKYNWLPEGFMDETGEKYAEDFQEEFNPLFDKYYNKIAELADFKFK